MSNNISTEEVIKNVEEEIRKKINSLNKNISKILKKIENERKNRCFLLTANITPPLVDEIFSELKEKYRDNNGKLDVIIHSPGGDIDAAYNIACLFQQYGKEKLVFIIPRWAKSAATLITCAGDEILMSPVAELGPLDPQITQINPIEERFEQFSPLHIQTTLDMIRNEYSQGNKDLADGLLKRLQFPLTLGSFLKAQEISEQYIIRLLKERMGKTGNLAEEPETIAKRLTTQYADHGFCINLNEAKKIGLNVKEINGKLLDYIWTLYNYINQRDDYRRKLKKKDLMKTLEKLPKEILDKIKSKENTAQKGDHENEEC